MQLRPHQEQAIQSMTDHDKGQVIVPTGGGKTICMIMDAIKQLEYYGTVVVVAPRILLAEQLCKEFMEILDEHYIDVSYLHVHSGKVKGMYNTTTHLRFNLFMRQQVVVRLYLQHIIHYIELSNQVSMLILSTLMKHTTQYRKTFSLLLITSLSMQVDAISLLLHQSIAVLLSRQG